jgi:hypothetical protein
MPAICRARQTAVTAPHDWAFFLLEWSELSPLLLRTALDQEGLWRAWINWWNAWQGNHKYSEETWPKLKPRLLWWLIMLQSVQLMLLWCSFSDEVLSPTVLTGLGVGTSYAWDNVTEITNHLFTVLDFESSVLGWMRTAGHRDSTSLDSVFSNLNFLNFSFSLYFYGDVWH